MRFDIDRNSLNDLEIFNTQYNSKCIFDFLNNTQTDGGKKLLLEIMTSPSCDTALLNQRTSIIAALSKMEFPFDIKKGEADDIEHYFIIGRNILHTNPVDSLKDYGNYKLRGTKEYYFIVAGLKALIKLLKLFERIISRLEDFSLPESFKEHLADVKRLLNHQLIRKAFAAKKLNPFLVSRLDQFSRKTHKQQLRSFLDFIYQIDVYHSVALLLTKNRWSLPEYSTESHSGLVINDLFHPLIPQAVPNSTALDENTTVIFLTGPNMAGKSSFLKAVGISIYLSHLGFPVPASKMKTQIFDGLITTINLPDNINEGLSHYYNEIKRLKSIVNLLSENKSLFLIFDEMFKGTNLKDALEASKIVISSFSAIKNSKFLVSSHFVELFDDLKVNKTLRFFSFGSSDENPGNYNYKLREGLNGERMGLHILRNEGIIAALQKLGEG
ncbi:hypothetical protein GS399_18090 [Pedobacter sp. HMF7647]|uniref:DNA mismatch repair proteins mutS family domain-containing protein n=1 Tax=Hufsiella arboris TaxID=2695275 RepID=A0A7K1YFL3_9SPHI|nr:hypothetical protein [Hufsiella arboris]MXV52888.1 hypothetical protein [Hufsiella arboris]